MTRHHILVEVGISGLIGDLLGRREVGTNLLYLRMPLKHYRMFSDCPGMCSMPCILEEDLGLNKLSCGARHKDRKYGLVSRRPDPNGRIPWQLYATIVSISVAFTSPA